MTAVTGLLADPGAPALEFMVPGLPAPQGSKRGFVRGKAKPKVVMVESSEKVKPWRAAVAYAALAAAGPSWEALDGPVLLDMVFSMPRPKSAPKTLRTVPDRIPDLSKLVRSTEDALGTDTNILVDDARIVGYRKLLKVYEGDQFEPDALRHPGVVVRIWPYPSELLGKMVG